MKPEAFEPEIFNRRPPAEKAIVAKDVMFSFLPGLARFTPGKHYLDIGAVRSEELDDYEFFNFIFPTAYNESFSHLGRHRLRYYEGAGGNKSLQYRYVFPNNKKFFVNWEVGPGSDRGLYFNLVDSCDFEFNREERVLFVRSLSGGKWQRELRPNIGGVISGNILKKQVPFRDNFVLSSFIYRHNNLLVSVRPGRFLKSVDFELPVIVNK